MLPWQRYLVQYTYQNIIFFSRFCTLLILAAQLPVQFENNDQQCIGTRKLCSATLSTRNSCFSISIQHSYEMGLEGLHDSIPLPSAIENPFPSDPFLRLSHSLL